MSQSGWSTGRTSITYVPKGCRFPRDDMSETASVGSDPGLAVLDTPESDPGVFSLDGALGDGSGREGFLHLAPDDGARALQDRLEPTELEPSQGDVSLPAERIEAEVGEEVRREDRPVDEEALVGARPLGVAVAERLHRLRSLVASLSDCGEEKALQHPERVRIDEIDARDQDGVVRRRTCRKLPRPREMARRPVLDEAEQAVGVAEVEGPPRPPVVLDLLRPLPLGGDPVTTGLPEHAPDARRRRVSDRRGGYWLEPDGHRRTSLVASGRARNRNGTKLVPSPRETCSVPAGVSSTPSQCRARRCSNRSLPRGVGRQIWPPWRWPARMRS